MRAGGPAPPEPPVHKGLTSGQSWLFPGGTSAGCHHLPEPAATPARREGHPGPAPAPAPGPLPGPPSRFPSPSPW